MPQRSRWIVWLLEERQDIDAEPRPARVRKQNMYMWAVTKRKEHWPSETAPALYRYPKPPPDIINSDVSFLSAPADSRCCSRLEVIHLALNET